MRHQNDQHFSHHHILTSFNSVNEAHKIPCNACDHVITQLPFHGCTSCQFYLHDQCHNAPRFMDHSSHRSHHLTLLPTPTYPSRTYTCNACASEGTGFSCARCEFDLHPICASLPSIIILDQHLHRELKLLFESPSFLKEGNYSFICDICQGYVDYNFWMYYCEECDFGTHVHCATDAKHYGGENEGFSSSAVPAQPDEGQALIFKKCQGKGSQRLTCRGNSPERSRR